MTVFLSPPKSSEFYPCGATFDACYDRGVPYPIFSEGGHLRSPIYTSQQFLEKKKKKYYEYSTRTYPTNMPMTSLSVKMKKNITTNGRKEIPAIFWVIKQPPPVNSETVSS